MSIELLTQVLDMIVAASPRQTTLARNGVHSDTVESICAIKPEPAAVNPFTIAINPYMELNAAAECPNRRRWYSEIIHVSKTVYNSVILVPPSTRPKNRTLRLLDVTVRKHDREDKTQ